MYDYELWCFFLPVLWIWYFGSELVGSGTNNESDQFFLINCKNFVNMYFKVAKFVFGYKYSTLESLYIAFQSPAVVL
jgi:hypothetical protein